MTSATRAFLDTNVLLYGLSDAGAKTVRAEELLRAGSTVSIQVLNEYVDVAQRKHRVPWSHIEAVLDSLNALCEIVDLTRAVHERALAIAKRHGYRIYDALIIAAAAEAGCTTLYSEDMQHGQAIAGLRIENPFAGL